MRRLIKIIVAIPFLMFGEAAASLLFLATLFGGILLIGLVIGHFVSYLLATVLAVGWAVLVLLLRDRMRSWLGESRAG
ncbi:MAG TPA: hypothetical protein VF595_12780 [Tepidisphaeraceae bacterium]|jgi:hypothetical protein